MKADPKVALPELCLSSKMTATGYLKQGGLVIPALKYTLKRWLAYSAITLLLLVILDHISSSSDDYSALYKVLLSFGLWTLYAPRWFFPYYLAYRQQQHQNRYTVRLEGLSARDTARFLYRPSLTMRITPLVCGLVSAILCMQIWSLLGDYQQAGDHDNTWLMLAMAVSALVSLAMAASSSAFGMLPCQGPAPLWSVLTQSPPHPALCPCIPNSSASSRFSRWSAASGPSG